MQMESETAATHEEIWDDSALIESWNQALDEYKKYHSIHAKGGTVDDIPNGAGDIPGQPIAQQGLESGAGEEEGEVDETEPAGESDETPHPTISDAQTSVPAMKQVDGMQGGGAPALGPQMVLGTVQDEDLKKLLMSWYYAGYYTGLFEGKQQGLQQAEEARRGR
ncbi:2e5541fd-4b44-4d88-afb6-a66b979379a3 [Thermothielavioides terrestris]|uniref:2e5541fd-4b44-4d88-afb6-a66b979379a3 n=1 Tax=Thermothielavioides terrestris TaxID=2587410 RepID=A0A3S4AVU3_9PEZI|nr:2e5541fd-4b44-4d88-afb6-a66b979379a3 [Thermothielavioides terrestris]